jgi:hypothetical protein
MFDESTHSALSMDESARSTACLTGRGPGSSGSSSSSSSSKGLPLYDGQGQGHGQEGEGEGEGQEGFRRIGCVCGGVLDDFRRRARHLSSDVTDSLSPKALSAAAFMFLATVLSTIALGAHLQGASNSNSNSSSSIGGGGGGPRLGVSEYLLMNGLSGAFFALTSPQPLLVLRPTGPITLILENLMEVSARFGINFWHLLAYCGYCTGGYLLLASCLELSRLTRHLTRFTHEVFACYVCSIYIVSGLRDVLDAFLGGEAAAAAGQGEAGRGLGAAVLMAGLAALTVGVCLALASLGVSPADPARRSWIDHASRAAGISPALAPSRGLRNALADNAVSIAVALSVVLSYLPALLSAGPGLYVERVDLPASAFPPAPTAPAFAGDGRDGWAVDFSEGGAGDGAGAGASRLYALGVAAVVSLPIAFFFYIDQNLSSLLSQSPHMPGMRKGVYMHGPMLIVAICNIVGPSFGLPFVTASLPHSPQLVEALTSPAAEGAGAGAGAGKEHCHEGRGAPLLIYVLILLTGALPALAPLVRSIPLGAARGVLVFVGIAGILHTQVGRAGHAEIFAFVNSLKLFCLC